VRWRSGSGHRTERSGCRNGCHHPLRQQLFREEQPWTDTEGTRALVQAALADGGKPHLVYISIVGVDHSTYKYYFAKRAAEALIEEGFLPWTIVRATQFHDLVWKLLQSFGIDSRSEVPVPQGMKFQSIDHREVADRLVTLVEQGPSGHTPDIGGPQVLTIEEMAATYLRLRGRKARVRPEALPGDMFSVFRSGVNLVPGHADGTITWEAFLQHLPAFVTRPGTDFTQFRL